MSVVAARRTWSFGVGGSLCAILAASLLLVSAPAFAAPPSVTEESFSNVGSASATVAAHINPGGEATSFIVEYGPTASYGKTTASVSVGAGTTAVSVVAHLEGLQPSTAYHYRFTATNPGAGTNGEDITFSTLEQSLLGLPDGRGYEMVTPPDNETVQAYEPLGAGFENTEVIGTQIPVRAAANGNAVVYAGEPDAEGNGGQGEGSGNAYLATRSSAGGWVQRNLQPLGFKSPSYVGLSADLSVGVLASYEALTPGVPNEYATFYTRNLKDGTLHPLSTVTPPNRTPAEFDAVTPNGFNGRFVEYYGGATGDSKRLFFEANDALTANAVDGGPLEDNLYESHEGALRLVNVLPDGSSEPGAFIGAPPASDSEPENSWHAVSEDGSRVFWTDLNTGALYVRENGTSTVLIAENATFLTAAADGSRVLYTKAGDLFEDDLVDDVTSDLAPGAELMGIAGASEDVSYVYFVGEGVLASGAIAGKPNLYLHHAGATTFIATLGSELEESVGLFYLNGTSEGDWQANLGHRTAEASTDGRALVFMSKQNLTGYDSRNAEGEKGTEVFVFDSVTGGLSCVSCIPSGERRTTSASAANISGYLPVNSSRVGAYQPRLISPGGARVVFQSFDGLVPQDTNHRADVYEWERDGTGSCRSSNGCIYLLSSGTSTIGSFFVDAGEDGSDVFFLTTAQLVAQDQNELFDVYDARIGAVAPSSPPVCTGSGCQGVPASPPVFATPASVTYAGVGNLPAPVKSAVKKALTPKHAHKQTKHKKKKKQQRKKKGIGKHARVVSGKAIAVKGTVSGTKGRSGR